MKPIGMEAVSSRRQSDIIFGHLSDLRAYCRQERTVIITDVRVREVYGDMFSMYPVVQIGRGEPSKTLRTVKSIYEAFLEQEVDRSWLVVGVGGGIVCDVTGFAAATFLRGLPFGFVPTTLLAQVDASIGGKNGVNLKGYKNQVGTFTQPDFVLCDFSVLRSLPIKEYKNGLAEAIEHALIADEGLFQFLESSVDRLLSLHPDAIGHLVYNSLLIKGAIVRRDETEKGERRKLNFGHTIGHALERVCKTRHGEAVSIGMLLAARLSFQRGLISRNDVERIKNLLVGFGLPVETRVEANRVVDAVRKDKKRAGNQIHMVLLDRIGQARIELMDIEELSGAIGDLR